MPCMCLLPKTQNKYLCVFGVSGFTAIKRRSENSLDFIEVYLQAGCWWPPRTTLGRVFGLI
jgi:hypothetical protein